MTPRLTRSEWLQRWADAEVQILNADLDESDRVKLLEFHEAVRLGWSQIELPEPEQEN